MSYTVLDNFSNFQIGENGSIEYTWSKNIREKICQLNFQLTRTRDNSVIHNLYLQTDSILKDLHSYYNSATISKEEYIEYMSIMFRMIGHTRDIIDGKGEYALSYMLLGVWHSHHPELAKFALQHFVLPFGTHDHPYGSWKDIKYLYKYTKSKSLVHYGSKLLITQLKADSVNNNPSLAAKWVPREKSQFGDMFTDLAIDYFYDYIVTAKNDISRRRAVIKAKMDFRKLISSLNKKLDTVQIKQCGLQWANIDPTKQTSITLHKQKRAFLNIDNNGQQRTETGDRIECANKFNEFIEKALNGEVEVKGKRIGLNEFTKEALSLCARNQQNSKEADILNAQWIDNSKQSNGLGKMIAMVDVSGSMDGEPLNAAIALGIRVAEMSLLGKRLLSFSARPSWINLEGIDHFVDMVSIIKRSDWGINANFFTALNMILDAIIINKMKPEDVQDMVLAIFSDMQMDKVEPNIDCLMDSIQKQYADAGQRLWKKDFKPPHILFWNLRSTSGFPSLSRQKNCSMMSGFSPALLNLFCEEGVNAFQSCTPWSLLVNTLNNERYDVLDKHIRENI